MGRYNKLAGTSEHETGPNSARYCIFATEHGYLICVSLHFQLCTIILHQASGSLFRSINDLLCTLMYRERCRVCGFRLVLDINPIRLQFALAFRGDLVVSHRQPASFPRSNQRIGCGFRALDLVTHAIAFHASSSVDLNAHWTTREYGTGNCNARLLCHPIPE